ncbi:hypothetical protein SSPO_066310 [Streptomyces antimycoticus]|uniref:Uncharacterized protein n=1 Tax=Streptomyces antimycoticus TaxID=68175 RepID=A0A499UPT1_9ACTN|nr:hypothetical protein SSPO_066310 [Streptomyces antimycoticus]
MHRREAFGAFFGEADEDLALVLRGATARDHALGLQLLEHAGRGGHADLGAGRQAADRQTLPSASCARGSSRATCDMDRPTADWPTVAARERRMA